VSQVSAFEKLVKALKEAIEAALDEGQAAVASDLLRILNEVEQKRPD
jgi:hypothetical protein